MDRTRFQFSLGTLLLITLILGVCGYAAFLYQHYAKLDAERDVLMERLAYVQDPRPDRVYMGWDETRQLFRYIIPKNRTVQLSVHKFDPDIEPTHTETHVIALLHDMGTIGLQELNGSGIDKDGSTIWLVYVEGKTMKFVLKRSNLQAYLRPLELYDYELKDFVIRSCSEEGEGLGMNLVLNLVNKNQDSARPGNE